MPVEMVVKDTMEVKGGKKGKKLSEPRGERISGRGFYGRTDWGGGEDRVGGPYKAHKPKQYSHQ
jgi:hypothetical protein